MRNLAEQRELAPVLQGAAIVLRTAVDHGSAWSSLSRLRGWDGQLLTQADYVNIIFSHDEYIQFLAKEETQLIEVRQVLGTAGR